ncbi:MAG: hypothetical protein JXB10_19040 [Pirellulales bacterium]|nr:hypothetical protein [Pirellulales bacterium]
MLQVTDAARELIKSALIEGGKLGNGCFRLSSTSEGAKIVMDQEQPEDVRVEHEGELVLVMDQGTAGQYGGQMLDFDNVNGRLVFR